MKVLSFLVGAILVCIILALWTSIFPDSPVKSERWLLSVILAQDQLAEDVSERNAHRIIVISGSNGLFGYNGEIVERETGATFVGAASHASFSLDFYSQRARKIVRPGDIIIMPLELELYGRKYPTNWEQQQSVAWVQNDYTNPDILSRLEQNWTTPLDILSTAAASRMIGGARVQSDSEKKAVERSADRDKFGPTADSAPFYTVEWLNRWGTINVPFPPRRGAIKHAESGGGYQYFSKASDISVALRQIKTLQDDMEIRGAQLYVTWPALMVTSADVSSGNLPKNVASLVALRGALADAGVSVICDPNDAFFPPAAFLDTKYHLNALGASVRSIRLAKCLGTEGLYKVNTEDGDDRDIDVAISARNALGADQYGIDERYQDFKKLSDALEDYRKQRGGYPVSEGWDGLHSKYGRSGPDWIRGLVPDFIASLPQDPRLTDRPRDQYLYRSNGRDYKIIAHSVDDHDLLKSFDSALVDPRRENAWGVWTEGARDW